MGTLGRAYHSWRAPEPDCTRSLLVVPIKLPRQSWKGWQTLPEMEGWWSEPSKYMDDSFETKGKPKAGAAVVDGKQSRWSEP